MCVDTVGCKVQVVGGYGGHGGESKVYEVPRANGMLGRLTAWNLETMQQLWSHEQRDMFLTSVLATAADLVFVVDIDR